MTIREALTKIGYDFGKLDHSNIGKELTLDTDISEHGMVVSEKLCTPGNGRWMVMVEIQKFDDWGMSRPWLALCLEKDAALLNPGEWAWERLWLQPKDVKRMVETER